MCCSCSKWVDFVKCEKAWTEFQVDSFSFECMGMCEDEGTRGGVVTAEAVRCGNKMGVDDERDARDC